MSVAVVTKCPTIYEADLPTVSYEDAPTPQIAHERLKQARQQGADRDGRARARDPELRAGPHRAARPSAGPTAGAWPRGARHHIWAAVGPGHRVAAECQRRGPRPSSPTGVQGVHPAGGRASGYDDRRHHQPADRPADGRWTQRDRRRHRPAISGSGHLRTARRTFTGLSPVLGVGRRVLQDVQLERGRAPARDPQGLG